MRVHISIALWLSLAVAAVSAPTPQARAYIEARRGHAICELPPRQARAALGYNGAVVEWAGVLADDPAEADASWTILRTHGGETFRARVAGAGRWRSGKPVYLIARVIERDGAIDHLNVLALGASSDITRALQESMRTASARAPAGAIGGVRGASISVSGAARWIVTFNRGMDSGTAMVLARSVLTSCQAYGVDARLALSLFAAESAFRTGAVSSAGAQGLGQLMPGTAAQYGVRNPFDPFENADASIRHLGDLLRRWRASPQAVQWALAAYNAGAGAVEQYGGIPPYAETVQYVKTILGYYAELLRVP